MAHCLYVGAWNFREKPVGLRVFREAGGGWDGGTVLGDLPAQSILALCGPCLVSVCEMGDGGKVACYLRDGEGGLTLSDVMEVPSAKLSYVTAAPDGRHVYVSSMGDGTVRMIRVSPEGKLTLTDEVRLTGHSVTPRQSQAKVHSVMISPDGSHLAAANLGADEVEFFRVDEERELLRLTDSRPVDFGREPRHMAFSPDGAFLYVLTEGGNRLYVYRVRGDALRELAAYGVLDPDGEQKGAAADIVVSRDGRRIYTTNRGQHNIAVWEPMADGLLRRLGFFPCGGKGPRGLNLSPDGAVLYSANNDDGTVAVLPLDGEGLPGAPVQILPAPAAGCVRSV